MRDVAQRGAVRTGPYFLLVVRDAQGRRLSVYLGVASPLVEEVRNELARLQASLRERRIFCRAQRQLRPALDQARRELDSNLTPIGLRRKGSEIRGWRFCRARLAHGWHWPSIGPGRATRSANPFYNWGGTGIFPTSLPSAPSASPAVNNVRRLNRKGRRGSHVCHWLCQCLLRKRLSSTTHWQSQWHTESTFRVGGV